MVNRDAVELLADEDKEFRAGPTYKQAISYALQKNRVSDAISVCYFIFFSFPPLKTVVVTVRVDSEFTIESCVETRSKASSAKVSVEHRHFAHSRR